MFAQAEKNSLFLRNVRWGKTLPRVRIPFLYARNDGPQPCQGSALSTRAKTPQPIGHIAGV
jgi:hypothetical protein